MQPVPRSRKSRFCSLFATLFYAHGKSKIVQLQQLISAYVTQWPPPLPLLRCLSLPTLFAVIPWQSAVSFSLRGWQAFASHHSIICIVMHPHCHALSLSCVGYTCVNMVCVILMGKTCIEPSWNSRTSFSLPWWRETSALAHSLGSN